MHREQQLLPWGWRRQGAKIMGMTDTTVLSQINLVVRDMERTLAFYRRLGLEIEADADAPHAAVHFPSGFALEFDTTDFVGHWDSAWPGSTGGAAVIGFALPSRAAVDETYADLTAAGYRGHQMPYDGFWGARYAIVDDPDGYPVGLMSPIEAGRKTWPPEPPPAST
jgi:catechol 2,3-dioxygenase-like lactoylglutathione lyase family enzyme